MKRKIIYIILLVVGLPVLIAIGFLAYLHFTEYKPAAIEMVEISGKGLAIPVAKQEFSFLSWNIGYAGLGREMDFFYDGGKMVRPGREETNKYLKRIRTDLKSRDSTDFIFLQEIDLDCKRTYHQNQLDYLQDGLSSFCHMFAENYRVDFIPVPVTEPMGRVRSGLGIFSKYMPESAERHAYDAFFPWPKRLAILKRCFLAASYSLGNGKQLIVINLHNSAYDEKGELRQKELNLLQVYLDEEYRKGNYIICGGDWNNNPRGFDPDKIITHDRIFTIKPAIDKSFMPGWEMVFDPLEPTNRNTNEPYRKGITGTTIIDFFIISPNVKKLFCHTIDRGFDNSDHQPVYARFLLNPE
jgi:endonuclease/exonuclease/phosphatase family metal-dependent hydrolase